MSKGHLRNRIGGRVRALEKGYWTMRMFTGKLRGRHFATVVQQQPEECQ